MQSSSTTTPSEPPTQVGSNENIGKNSLPDAAPSVDCALDPSPLQAALEAIKSSDEYAAAKCRAIVRVYHERWFNRIKELGLKVKDVEKEFRFDLLNPGSDSGKSRSFEEAGKFDVLLFRPYSNQIVVLEHKCLAGHTEIFNHDTGTYQTMAFMAENNIAPTVTAMHKNGGLTIAKAKVPVIQPKRDAIRFTLRNGRSITASGNHPFLTEDGWVLAEDLRIGSELAEPIFTPSNFTGQRFTDSEIKIIGYMICDGSCSSSLTYTKNDQYVRDDFERCAKELGEISHFKKPNNKAWYYQPSQSGPVYDLLNTVGLYGCLSKEKHIPNIPMSDRQCGILLGALWSGDGCIDVRKGKTSPRIIYGSVSLRLCNQIQSMLQRFGCVSSVTSTSVEYKGSRRPFYQVKVIGRSSKLRFLNYVLSGLIPIIRSSIKLEDALNSIQTSKYGSDNKKGLRESNGIYWNTITGISPTDKIDLYDIEVPTHHTFIANGIITHNTSSEDISDGSDYWDRLRMDTQVSKYFIGAHQYGLEVDGVLYDVVKKTGHRPANVPILDDDMKKIVEDKDGNRVFLDNGKPRQAPDAEKGWVLKSRPETPCEYENRLVSVYREGINDLFKDRMIYRTDSETLEYLKDSWAISQQILYFRHQDLWPRNPNACLQYGTCEYLDLCSGRASIDNIRYQVRDQRNPELEIKEDGKQFLTKSRCYSLRKCPRHHKLRYEDRVVRIGEESDALAFGTLYHKVLEAYWLKMKEIQ